MVASFNSLSVPVPDPRDTPPASGASTPKGEDGVRSFSDAYRQARSVGDPPSDLAPSGSSPAGAQYEAPGGALPDLDRNEPGSGRAPKDRLSSQPPAAGGDGGEARGNDSAVEGDRKTAQDPRDPRIAAIFAALTATPLQAPVSQSSPGSAKTPISATADTIVPPSSSTVQIAVNAALTAKQTATAHAPQSASGVPMDSQPGQPTSARVGSASSTPPAVSPAIPDSHGDAVTPAADRAPRSDPRTAPDSRARLGGIERLQVVPETQKIAIKPETGPGLRRAAPAEGTALQTGSSGNGLRSQVTNIQIGIPEDQPDSSFSFATSQTIVPGDSPLIAAARLTTGKAEILPAVPTTSPVARGATASMESAPPISEKPSAGDHGGDGSSGNGQSHTPTNRSSEQVLTGTFGAGAPVAGDSASVVSSSGPSAPMHPGVDRFQIADQVSRHLESVRFGSGNSELTLNLAPAHLGALRLTISSNEHGVAARIVVQSAQAHQAVEAAKDQLRTALENRGFHVTSLDVSLGQNASDGSNAFTRQRDRSAESVHRGTEAAPDQAATLATETIPAVAIRYGDSSSFLDYEA